MSNVPVTLELSAKHHVITTLFTIKAPSSLPALQQELVTQGQISASCLLKSMFA